MSEETVPAHPYLKLLADSGADPLDILASSPAKLDAMLQGVTPEQAERKPSPEKWNLREIVAHIADCEIAWSWRFRQIYGGRDPELQPFEQDRWAGVYKGCTLAQAQETWRVLRAWNVSMLRTLSPEERDKPAHHPDMGAVTLGTVADIAAGHDLHHLHSLEHVVKALHERG